MITGQIIPSNYRRQFVYAFRNRVQRYWKLCGEDDDGILKSLAKRFFTSTLAVPVSYADLKMPGAFGPSIHTDFEKVWSILRPRVDEFCLRELSEELRSGTKVSAAARAIDEYCAKHSVEPTAVLLAVANLRHADLAAIDYVICGDKALAFTREKLSSRVHEILGQLESRKNLAPKGNLKRLLDACDEHRFDWYNETKQRVTQRLLNELPQEVRTQDGLNALVVGTARNVGRQLLRRSLHIVNPLGSDANPRIKLSYICDEVLSRNRASLKRARRDFWSTRNSELRELVFEFLYDHLDVNDSNQLGAVFDEQSPSKVGELLAKLELDSFRSLRNKIRKILAQTGTGGREYYVTHQPLATVDDIASTGEEEPDYTKATLIEAACIAELPVLHKHSQRGTKFPLRGAVIFELLFEDCYPRRLLQSIHKKKAEVIAEVLDVSQSTYSRWMGKETEQSLARILLLKTNLNNLVTLLQEAPQANLVVAKTLGRGMLLSLLKDFGWYANSRRQALVNWWINQEFSVESSLRGAAGHDEDTNSLTPKRQDQAQHQFRSLLRKLERNRPRSRLSQQQLELMRCFVDTYEQFDIAKLRPEWGSCSDFIADVALSELSSRAGVR